jgi:hypothetical protein
VCWPSDRPALPEDHELSQPEHHQGSRDFISAAAPLDAASDSTPAENEDRYAILDQIMPNADRMTRQRLEMAYDSGRISVLGKDNLYDKDDFNFAVRMQTAFQNGEIVTLRRKLEALSRRLDADELELADVSDDPRLSDLSYRLERIQEGD